MTDYLQAFQNLVDIEPNVANVSLSLIEGETLMDIRPSIASDVLLYQKIPYAPVYKVKDTYADKLFRYKDIIEVEYSANYVDNDALVSVYRSEAGVHYVHYLIEPKKLSLERNGNNYQTTILINGIVTDENGRQVYQFDRRLPLNLRSEQFNSIKDRLMSFQDVFPLVPGKYKLSILLKNYVSKEFTSFEASLDIPESGLQMSPLILANRLTRNNQYRGLNKAFLLDDLQFVPSPRNDFVVGDTLYVVFQLWGLTPELKQGGSLTYEIMRENGDKVKSFSRKLSDYQAQGFFYEEISLQDWAPANYMLTVTLTDSTNNGLITQKANFFISHLPSLSRSWVMTQPMEGDASAEVQHALGIQYWNRQDKARAAKYLETAYRRNPGQASYALDFCRLLLDLKKYQEVMEIATPFVSQQQNYDFLEILGQAAQALGQYEQAINYYKQYLAHFGTNINVLNAIGECYLTLGDTDEALYAWERSLQLEPGQENIKAQVKALKEKK